MLKPKLKYQTLMSSPVVSKMAVNRIGAIARAIATHAAQRPHGMPRLSFENQGEMVGTPATPIKPKPPPSMMRPTMKAGMFPGVKMPIRLPTIEHPNATRIVFLGPIFLMKEAAGNATTAPSR